MAELVSIQGQGYLRRHPLGVLGLSFITLGVYFFYWYYRSTMSSAGSNVTRRSAPCAR
jgi:hypothetical protein